MTYHEPKDPRTGKAPDHQKAALKAARNISNAEIRSVKETTVDLYFSACDDIAVRILKGGWNPELFGQKELHLTTIEQYAEVLAKKNHWGNVIQVTGVPQHLLEPNPKYEGRYTTKEIIDKKSVLIPYTLILKTALPKEHFIGRKSIPNMPGITDMDSPDFIIRTDKKYTPFFLRLGKLEDYLRRIGASDIELLYYIEREGSILGVPDNTKIYSARYFQHPIKKYSEEMILRGMSGTWNPYSAEVISG